MQSGVETARVRENASTVEGSPEESTFFQLNNNNYWLPADQSNNCSSANPSNGATSSEWGRCNMPSWGGRIVGRGQSDTAKASSSIRGDGFDAFMNVFEGGSLLYCNMSFEALLNVRKQLEELGFPCKAVNDGLWLQVWLHFFCTYTPLVHLFACLPLKSCNLPYSPMNSLYLLVKSSKGFCIYTLRNSSMHVCPST